MRIFFLVLLTFSLKALASNECGNHPSHPSITESNNLETNIKTLGEVKATDLAWKEGNKIPEDISLYIKNHDQIPISQFAHFDLNQDGIDEIIIKSSALSGSGGQGFMFLEKQNGSWNEIVNFTGGFILSRLDVPKSYNQKYYTMTQHLLILTNRKQ